MRHLAALLVLLLAGCSGNLPPIPPGPPKACPASCPTGTACTDPAEGCQPIPAPGPVCQAGQGCGCWHLPPSALGWLYACCAPGVPGGVVSVQDPAQCPAEPPPAQACPESCPAGQECIDPSKGCVPKPSCPKPCPVVGWVCTDPAVGCVPVTPPPASSCPWKLSDYPGVHLEANTKYWGQGLDHTTLVVGSSRYCADRGWTDGRASCQVAIDGDPNKVTCEVEFGGGCPRFEFRQNGVQHPCVDDQNDFMSCDHFGDPVTRDDPQTPTTGNTLATLRGFEGEPKVCGLQRIGDKPIAGFFTIAHGFGGEARSCVDSTFSACGPWLAVNH